MARTPTKLEPRHQLIEGYRLRIADNKRSKLSSAASQSLVQHFINDLVSLRGEAAIKARCDEEIALLEEGYTASSVAKNKIPAYRKAIEEAIADGTLPMIQGETCVTRDEHPDAQTTYTVTDHYGYIYIAYSQEDYQRFNQQTTQRNNERQDHLEPVPLESYLTQLEVLLSSDSLEEQAIAIAGATGRRFSETITGTFERVPGSPYELAFSGQLKKRNGDVNLQYRVHTLFHAQIVMSAWKALREHPDAAELRNAEPRMINSKLNQRVNRRIKRLFQDTGLVPVLQGEKKVTIHNLRGIYGEIAIHFFCPPSQHPHRFVQQQLGHVIRADELATKVNSSSTTHYFHYYLVDYNGNPVGGRGVMLDAESPKSRAVTEGRVSDRQESSGTSDLEKVVAQLARDLAQMKQTMMPPAPTPAPEPPAPKPVPKQPEVKVQKGTSQQLLVEVLGELQGLKEQMDAANQQREVANQQREAIIQLLTQQQAKSTETVLGNALTQLGQGLLGENKTKASPRKVSSAPVKSRQKASSTTSKPETKGQGGDRSEKEDTDLDLRAMPSEQLKPLSLPGVAAEKIRRAYIALTAYNDEAGRSLEEKWQVNQSILCQLTGCNIPAVRQFCKDHGDEIRQHNAKHELKNRHNGVHTRQNEDIQNFVQW